MKDMKSMQEANTGKGLLQVNVVSSVNSRPVEEAEVSISYTGVPENILEKLTTDSSGRTEVIELDAPPEEWSLDPENARQPYSEYTFDISAPGFEPVSISGAEGSEVGDFAVEAIGNSAMDAPAMAKVEDNQGNVTYYLMNYKPINPPVTGGDGGEDFRIGGGLLMFTGLVLAMWWMWSSPRRRSEFL